MPPVNPSIAMGIRPIEIQQRDPLQEYAQVMSIQNAQIQNQLARQQMEQEQSVINYLRTPSNLTTPEGRAGLRQFGKTGLAYEKLLADQEMNALKRQELEGKLRDQRMTALGTGLTSVLVDPSDANLAAAFDRLDATGVDTKPFRQQFANMPDLAQRKVAITQYVTSNPEGRQALAFVQPKPEKADLYGQTVWIDTNPNSPTYLKPVQTLEDRPLPPGVEAQKSRIAKAGATNVNVSTEKKYGERFGGLIAERDANKLDVAEKAPQLANDANRIIDLVRQGNLFTGPAADIKLNIARALNVAGASNQEKIANTEALIAATGQSTLSAIKGAGLGTGQGFTDKDLKFLQGVAGGTINLTQQTLTELARLQHQVAVKSAESWNRRVKELPQDALRGTGLSTEPIVVPPLSSVIRDKNAAPAPTGVDPALWSVMTPQERALWQK